MTIQVYPAAKSQVTSNFWRYTAVGGETTLTGVDNSGVTLYYYPNQEQVFLNGVLLVRGVDYTATSGTSITGLASLVAGDTVQVNCYSNFTITQVPVTALQGSITNLQLANSSVTIGGQTINLGGSQSTFSGITLTSPTLNNAIISTTATGAAPLTINGIASQTGDYLDINTLASGGTSVLKLTSSGKLGLGTTSPSATFDMAGSAQFRGANSTGAALLITPDSTSGSNGTNINNSFVSGGYGPLSFSTNGSTSVTIDSSQNMGIGVGSGNIVQKLDVLGNINMNSGLTTAGRKTTYQIGVGDAGTVGQKASILFSANGSSTYGYLTDIVFANFNGDFYNSTLTERLRIGYNGKIGINQSSPVYMIDAAGIGTVAQTLGSQALGLQLQSSPSNISYLQIADTRTNNSNAAWPGAGWRLQQKIDATWMAAIGFNGGQQGYSTNDFGITFYVSGGSTSAVNDTYESMRMSSNGYLLIGYKTSNGSYPLQVNGQIFATSASIATSDIKYKENVEEINQGLSLIDSLRPVTFNWKKQFEEDVVDEKMIREKHNFPEGRQVGFIAQDVQEAFKGQDWLSSIVVENTREEIKDVDGNIHVEEEPFLGLAETHLIPILVAAVKELSAKVKKLEANNV